VADAQGLSYYSDVSVLQRLNMDDHALAQARLELIRIGLIAWQKPIYQVLGLQAPSVDMPKRSPAHPQLLAISLSRSSRRLMIDYELFCKIKNLKEQHGLRTAQISRELSLDPRTVANCLKQDRFKPRKSTPKKSKLDPLKTMFSACSPPIPTARPNSSTPPGDGI